MCKFYQNIQETNNSNIIQTHSKIIQKQNFPTHFMKLLSTLDSKTKEGHTEKNVTC